MKYSIKIGKLWVKSISLTDVELVKYPKFGLRYESKYEALDVVDDLLDRFGLSCYVVEVQDE